MILDTRHALRSLRIAPSFTAATVLALALGIGATTSIFTLVHAVLLKSLPWRIPPNYFAWGVNRTPATSTGTASKESGAFVSTIFTNTCGITPKALPPGRSAHSRRRSAEGCAGSGDELPPLAGTLRLGSISHWGGFQSRRQAIYDRGNCCFGLFRGQLAQPFAGANDRAKFPEQTLYLTPGGAESQACANDTNAGLQILMMLAYFMAHEEDPINSLLFMVRELNTIRPTCVILLVSFGSIV
jgi:hypothetical protein